MFNLLLLLAVTSAAPTDRSIGYRTVYLPDISEDAEIGHQLRGNACTHQKCDFIISDLYGTHVKDFIGLDKSTGSLYVKSKLDRELLVKLLKCKPEDCVLKFKIFDRLNNEKENVHVRILDINDNRPKFSMDSVEIRILENAPIGYLERLPTASDPDHGNNSILTYYLFDIAKKPKLISHTFSLSNLFGLVQMPLSLQVRGPLDYEERREYTFRLVAVDNGTPSLRSEINVTVKVEDVNDNSPHCFPKQLVSVQINENASIGSVVGHIKARDHDSPKYGTLIYSIQSITPPLPPPDQQPLFQIDPNNGTVFLTGNLDHERVQQYVLDVKVEELSGGSFPAICSLQVDVVDVNDNGPRVDLAFFGFEKDLGDGKRRIIINEETQIGTQIGELVIGDTDDQLDNFGWNMIFNCGALKAIPTENGEYSIVTNALDRESKDFYQCAISAIDRSPPHFNTTVQFEVQVIDANDNPPSPKFPDKISFREDISIGTVIGILRASDADDGENAQLNYRLIDDLSSFNLSQDGVLRTNREFDSEAGDDCFDLKVRISDNGQPKLSTDANLRVCVMDANDNRPLFRFKSYTFNVREDTLIGNEIGSVIAYDNDKDANGRVNYYFCNKDDFIDSKPNSFPFSIESTNGSITLANYLDHETTSFYEMDVCAEDSGEPRNVGDRAKARFFILNVNDNCPSFNLEKIIHYINRDNTTRQSYEFQVKDQDGDNVEVTASASPQCSQPLAVDLMEKINNSHRFELYFKDKLPEVTFCAITLQTKDIPIIATDRICQSVGHVIFVIGTNKTNRTALMEAAEMTIQKFNQRAIGATGIVRGITKSHGVFIVTITLTIFALLLIAIVVYSYRQCRQPINNRIIYDHNHLGSVEPVIV